ncbi:unnamed protein product, partial [Discosporangium mesarthrocarpum]
QQYLRLKFTIFPENTSSSNSNSNSNFGGEEEVFHTLVMFAESPAGMQALTAALSTASTQFQEQGGGGGEEDWEILVAELLSESVVVSVKAGVEEAPLLWGKSHEGDPAGGGQVSRDMGWGLGTGSRPIFLVGFSVGV